MIFVKDYNLLFYLKKRGNYEMREIPVYLPITIKGRRSEIFTSLKCDPKKWNKVVGRKTGLKSEVREFNTNLDKIQTKIFQIYYKLLDRGGFYRKCAELFDRKSQRTAKDSSHLSGS